jgi:hypothetical protein
MDQEHAQATFASGTLDVVSRAKRGIAADERQRVNAILRVIGCSLGAGKWSYRRLNGHCGQIAHSISTGLAWRGRLAEREKAGRYDGQVNVPLIHPVGDVAIRTASDLNAKRYGA